MNEKTEQMPRLPWAVTLSGVISLGALLLTGHGAVPLAYVYVAALIATYFINARIENGSPVRWFVRVALLGIAYASSRIIDASSSDFALLQPWARNFFGLVYGGEMLVQAWRYVPGNPRAPLVVLFLSGFVFLTACNTFEDTNIRFLAPLYVLSLLLGLRSYNNQTRFAGETSERSRRATTISARMRAGAVCLALLSGLVGFRTFNQYRGDITDWGNNLLGQRLERFETSLMAEQPSLGQSFGLRGSPVRVLRLTGTEGYAGDPHLRGMSFDTYTDGTWGPGVRERANLTPNVESDLRLPTGVGNPLIGVTTVVQVTRLARGNPLIYAPLNVSEVDLADAEKIRWAPEYGGPIRTPAAPPFTYTLSIPANENIQGILAEKMTPESRKRYMDVPKKLDPKVRKLARSIVADAKRPRDKIDNVVAYLMTHHQYSLTIDPGPGDPVTNFLLSNPPKDAHCEYFAASAALLLRCVGVPTRYVTGYYVHEGDGPNTSIVRQRDAHAWAEAWVNGFGWVTVDATPGSGRPDFQPEPIAKAQAFWERIQDAFQSVRDWLGDLKPEQINLIVGSLTISTLVGGAIYLLIRRRQTGQAERVPGYDAYAGADERLAALAGRFEQELVRHGQPSPQNRTWQEHLSSVANHASEDQPQTMITLARRFISLYERARFGTLLRETEDAVAAMDEMQDLLTQMEALPADTGGRRPTKGTLTTAA
ncbi:MAG: transglutaminaseTgpA domain-containing protein [Armatimonadota bacterium]